MAQQYNPRRAQPAPNKKKKPSGASPNRGRGALPGWAWLVVGVVVGVFVSFLVKLANTAPTATTPVATKTAPPAALKTPEKTADKTPPPDAKPVTKFDFYTLLPEREVIVPNEREAIQPKPPQSGPNTAPESQEQLFLQAGSFRSPQEAERRRAQIVQLGLEARVESVVANGDTWYRVHAGPFTSRDKLSKARDQLSGEGIESLLLKQKPAG